jgi:hypothetical protein
MSDLLGERRLRHMKPLRRTTKMPLLGHGNKVLEVSSLH